LHRSV